jgi:hypothetical protein
MCPAWLVLVRPECPAVRPIRRRVGAPTPPKLSMVQSPATCQSSKPAFWLVVRRSNASQTVWCSSPTLPPIHSETRRAKWRTRGLGLTHFGRRVRLACKRAASSPRSHSAIFGKGNDIDCPANHSRPRRRRDRVRRTTSGSVHIASFRCSATIRRLSGHTGLWYFFRVQINEFTAQATGTFPT